MFSKFSSLLCNNIFLVSRQKVLLKIRKIASKKQKVAKKKFLEQNPNGSYTNQLRILQIQKQLDKKVNKNHHLNELMDELFYPDVRYANEKIMQQNLLNLANNPQQALAGKNKYNKLTVSEQGEQTNMQQIDELVQQIYLCQIPAQLFQLYMKNSQLFTHEHLGIYLDRLGYYFKNKDVIQERITLKWKQSLEKMKITDAERKKKRRCPYVFIEQQELIRDEEWNKVVRDINKKISKTIEHIANQKIDQGTQQSIETINKEQDQQQQEFVDESFYSLQKNCELVLKITETANYMPEELFDTIVEKMFVILNLNTQKQVTPQRLPIFSHQQKVKLLKVLSQKSNTKSTLTKSLQIESPQFSQKQQQKLIAVGKKICEDILNSQKCTAEDLGVVFQTDKGQYNFLNSMLLDLSKPKILQFLSSTNLERTIDYLCVFWKNGTTKDSSFIEVLVFDIYRKLPYTSSKSHLFLLFNMIKHSRLNFRQSKISISVSEIFPRFTESVAKYLNKGELTHDEIKVFLKSVYENYPLYKAQGVVNILEMISTAVVKIGDGYKLQELTKLLFKTTVMGHRSKIFSKYVFQRYLKEYRKLMREYKQSKTQLITDKSSKGSKDLIDSEENELPSLNEVLLEQSLVMMFWCFVVNYSIQNNTTMPLSEMIEIYPLAIRSQDPMISDLIQDLNLHLKDFNFFPTIKNRDIYETKTKQNRRKSIKAVSLLLKTNSFQNYRYQYNQYVALELLKKLQQDSQLIDRVSYQKIVLYLIKYCVEKENLKLQDQKIPDRWNDCVMDILQHRDMVSKDLKNQFMQKVNQIKESSQEKTLSPILQRVIDLVKNKKVENVNTKNKLQEKSQKPYKLYELL